MKVNSRFNDKFIFGLIAGLIVSFLTSLFLLQLFAGVLFILWLFEKSSEKKKAFDIYILLILLFGAVRILTALFSEYPELSNQIYYKELVFYLSAISLNFYLKSLDKKYYDRILQLFVLSGAFIAVIGLLRFNLNLTHRSNSFISGYSTFSMFILAVYSFYLGWKNKLADNDNWYISALLIALFGSALITSLGRTNVGAAILITLAAIFLKNIKVKEVLLAVLVIAAITGISFINNSSEIGKRTENISTLSDRDVIYKGFLVKWDEHILLGNGPKTFKEAFPLRDQFEDKGIGGYHNQYIEVYMDSGILGLISFLAIPVFILITLFKNKSQLILIDKRNKTLLGLSFSFAALYMCVLTDGFVGQPIMEPVFAFFMAVFANEMKG